MSSDPRKLVKQLSKEIDDDLRSFNNDLHQMLRATTPIRTGNARSGWKNIYRPGNIGRGTEIPLQENRVPYISALDDGWSRQAPRGIVDEAVRKTRKKR